MTGLARSEVASGASTLVAGALLSGCGQAATPSSDRFGERLVAEAEGLARQFSLGTLALVLMGLGVAVVGVVLSRLLVLGLWRLGFDTRRRLSVLAPLVRTASIIAGVLWGLSGLLSAAPLLSVVFLPATGLALLWLFGRPLENLACGLWLILSRRVRVGDRLRVGRHEGLVEHLGWGRVALQSTGAVRVDLPARDLLLAQVEVARERNSQPVSIRVYLASVEDSPALRRDAQRLALLCPYRVASTDVRVTRVDASTLQIRLHTWSEPAARLAEEHLRDALERWRPSGDA